MIALATRRLAWKEYHLQRDLWLAVLVASVVVQLMLVLLARWEAITLGSAQLAYVGFGFPAFFAIGCGATLFAGEDEIGTRLWQRMLPLSARQLAAVKLMVAILSLLAMFLASGLAGFLLARLAQRPYLAEPSVVTGSVLAAFEVLGWSVLFSLVTRRVLLSIPLAAMAAVAGAYLPAMAYALLRPGESGTFDEHNVVWPSLRVLVLALVGIEIQRRIAPWFLQISTPAARGQATSASPLRRLLWLGWQQSRFWLPITVASTLLLGVTGGSTARDVPGLFVVMLFAPPLIAGCLAFGNDAQKQQHDFLAIRGVSARRLWLSRQLLIGVPLLLAGLVAALGARASGPSLQQPAVYGIGFGGVALSYACGQLMAFAIRRVLISIFAALCLSLPLLVGMFVAVKVGLPLMIAVAPGVVWMLLLTLWLAPDWLQHFQVRRLRWSLALAIVLPLMMWIGLIAGYRILEVPAVPASRFTVGETSASRATLRVPAALLSALQEATAGWSQVYYVEPEEASAWAAEHETEIAELRAALAPEARWETTEAVPSISDIWSGSIAAKGLLCDAHRALDEQNVERLRENLGLVRSIVDAYYASRHSLLLEYGVQMEQQMNDMVRRYLQQAEQNEAFAAWWAEWRTWYEKLPVEDFKLALAIMPKDLQRAPDNLASTVSLYVPDSEEPHPSTRWFRWLPWEFYRSERLYRAQLALQQDTMDVAAQLSATRSELPFYKDLGRLAWQKLSENTGFRETHEKLERLSQTTFEPYFIPELARSLAVVRVSRQLLLEQSPAPHD